jgi:4-amino-4-deoxy-L-arabinose transferase-like glycosyltransferase
MKPFYPAGERRLRPATALSLLLSAALALLVGGRLSLPFLEPEESLYAVIPRDMLADGQFVVPVLHGEPYLDKPPLLYWLVMGCYRLFGVHVWSARLVPTIAAWLTVLVVFAWGRACSGWTAGLVSAAVLTLTGDFVYRGPMLTPNGLLGLFTTTGLASGQLALRHDRVRGRWWVASAVATGLGVLTKGPVALVLVTAPLFVLPRLIRGFARPGVGGWLLYLGVVVLVSAAWFVAITARHPEFLEYFLWKHHVQRFTDPFDHAKPAYFYLPQLFLGGLPWTLLPVAALRSLLARRRPPDRLSPDGRFALLAVALAFLFFSLSGSKRPAYLVPLWPVLAFGIGATLAPVIAGRAATILGVSRKGWLWAGGAVSAVLVLGVFAWLPAYHRQFGLAETAEVVTARAPSVPVYCYPHTWNSLEFYLGSGAMLTFHEADRARLIERLRSSESVLLVVERGTTCAELIASLPDDLETSERGASGLVTILLVRRRPGRVGRSMAP